jgi:hypothetical protein
MSTKAMVCIAGAETGIIPPPVRTRDAPGAGSREPAALPHGGRR